jgi:hypothetical protein
MKRTFRVLVALSILPLATTALRAQDHVHVSSGISDTANLGTVSFPNTGRPAAQAPFLRGLALLHSFEYGQAAAAFREAQQRDRGFTLAYYMEAVTRRQGVWGTEQLDEARSVLAKLAPNARDRLKNSISVRERQFATAVEVLFAYAPEAARVRGWSDSLSAYAARDPDDPEWSAFAAIALMDAMKYYPRPERARLRDSSARLAQRVFDNYPNHPGGAHFVIHANDDPEHAPLAEDAARAYAKIAPASEHALHMPSHTFVQLGLWDDAATSNERAWAVSAAQSRERKDLTSASWHILFWLQYSYLQQGKRHAARALIDTALARLGPRADTLPGIDKRFALDDMRFQYAANTGEWAWEPTSEIRVPERSDRAFMMEVQQMYRTALTAQMRGGGPLASAARLRGYSDSLADSASGPMVGAWERHLSAALAARNMPRDLAIQALKAHTASDTSAPLGPPKRLISAELLGQLLLDAGRGPEAAAAYELSLRMHPKRSNSLLGLARAKKMAGDTAGSAQAYKQLLVNWRAADADLPELAEVKAGAALAN